MSQRVSGWARKDSEHYPTPAWVLDALAEHINLNGLQIWEPACGGGQMSRAMEAHGAHVTSTDLIDQTFEGMADLFDFTGPDSETIQLFYLDGIVTNPPYGPQGRTGEAFIARGLERIPPGGFLALLLPVDFDSAKGRAKYFGDCPHFAAKIVLRRRIMWFEPEPGSKSSSPSQNHAWFIWERSHIRRGAATLYSPSTMVQAA